jgi:hypothetical protein
MDDIIRHDSTRFMSIILIVLISIEILDISINKIFLFINSIEFPFSWDILTFVIVLITYSVGQHFILRYASRSSSDIRIYDKLQFSLIRRLVKIIQYILLTILFVVLLQMIITSHYNSRFLICSIWISYGLAILMLGLLTKRFFYWFVSNKNIIVLLYCLSTAFIAVNAGISLVMSTLLLIDQPVEVQQIVGSMSPSIPNDIIPLNYAFILTSIISFILTWIATVLILRSYSSRLGTVKYWITVSIPLVYFLTQFQPLFISLFYSYSSTNPISFAIAYTIIFSASKPGGGILFAAAFWSMAKNIGSKQVRDYMIISAYGLALIFGSEQAIILADRPYPPFGLATISFLGLASYLVLIGIYASAISVSEDSKLRRSIRNFAINESKLLGDIGMAQMEQDIQKKIITFTKQNKEKMTEETGIQSSLTEEDMKEYLEKVIREVNASTLGKNKLEK